MPSTWDNAQLENLTVGNNQLKVIYEKNQKTVKLTIEQSQKDWQIQLAFPAQKYGVWKLNGQPMTPKKAGSFNILEAKGAKMELELELEN